MRRLALIGLVVFMASCTKHYTCTCKAKDSGTVTQMESYDHVRLKTAKTNCDALSAKLNPPYSVRENSCTLSE
jgi:hypothetical protein